MERSEDVSITGPPGRSIFEFSRYVRRLPVGVGEPDLLSLSVDKGLDFDGWAAGVPAAVWEHFATSPSTRVIVDASGEGTPHRAAETQQLHAFLTSKRIPLHRAVYLTQYRPYAAEYGASRREAGPLDLMRIVNADYFIRRFFLEIDDGEALLQTRLRRYRQRADTRQRRMVSLNLTPRRSKLLFLLRLLRDGLWDHGFISVGDVTATGRATTATDAIWDGQIAELQREWALLKAVAPLSLEAEPVIGRNEHFSRVYRSELHEYDHSWFTVVTETEMLDGMSRITEKPLKAFVNFHPIVMLASAGALSLLHDLGFRTFGGVFDEGYDSVTSAEKRFDLVYNQVADLLRADEAELARRMAVADEVLLHNARWGLTRLPKIFRKQKDKALLSELLA